MTDKPAIPDAPVLSVQLLKGLRDSLIGAVKSVKVETVEDVQRLAAMGPGLKAYAKMVEADKDAYCKPLNTQSRAYAKPRNEILKSLEPVLAYIRDEPIRFQAEQEAKQKALLHHAAATGAGPREIEKAAALTVPKIEGHQTAEHWVAVVEDPAKVPEQYKMILQAELDREARAKKEAFNVPGCRVEKVKRGSIV